MKNETGKPLYYKVAIFDARFPEVPFYDPGIIIKPGQEIDFTKMVLRAIDMTYKNKPNDQQYSAGAIIHRTDSSWVKLPDQKPEYFAIKVTPIKYD